MGKSSNPTIGYWYKMTEHFGVCYGPVDGLYEIKGGGRTAWSGEVTANQDIRIAASDLYGGKHKEGGIDGVMSVYMGEPDQAPPKLLVTLLGAPQPAYRGLVTLVFDGTVGAMNPYLKPVTFRVGRWVKGWRTPVWEPALCRIDKGMNPAHIIYRMITDPVTGLGQDAQSTLDLDRMRDAAQTLYNEGLGLVLKWTRRDVINGMVGEICNHVGGEMSYDPRTGKQFLRLIRGGYDVTALPVLDESNVIELTSHEQATIFGAVNSITMTYHNCDTDADESVTVTNPANIRAQGETIDKPLNYPGLWNRQLGVMAAMRELNAVSSLPARGKLKLPSPLLAKVNGVLQEVDIIKGDVLALSWKELNLVGLPIRIQEIDRGTWTDNATIVSYSTDVLAMPTQSYIGDQPTTWVEPDNRPLPVPAQRLLESSYRDLAGTLRDADLALLSLDSGHVGALGTRASGVAYNYALATRVGDSGPFTTRGAGDFAPTGLLPAIVPASVDPIVATLTSTRDLDLVAVGTEALIDDEVLRVDAIDPATGKVTLARGCGDTLPAAHNANARVWFTDYFTGTDPSEYLAGETIQAKLLTRTGQGQLDESLAPVASLTLARRQARPYPPADLKVAGKRGTTQVVGKLDLSWSHRDRKAQRDQLVDATQPSIGPEAGTTYTVRVYINGLQVANQAGIVGATWSSAFNTGGSMRVEVISMRDGLTSWQTATTSFAYISALAVAGDAPDGVAGTAYDYSYTAAGGQVPYRWSVQSGALPAGLTLDANSGRLTGTPTADGTIQFTVAVTDAVGQTATLTDTIVVSAADVSYPAVVAVDAPIAWWRLQDNVADNGVAADSSGKLRNGVYRVGAADAALQPGPGLVNGTTRSYNKGGANPAGMIATIPAIQGSYSVVVWIKTTDVGATREVVAIDDERSQRLFQLRLAQGKPQLVSIRGTIVSLTGPTSVADNMDHMLEAEVDTTSTTNNIRLYVDGVLVATGSGDASGGAVSAPVCIGCYQSYDQHPEYQFVGATGDVSIYNKTLGADRVAAHWAAGQRVYKPYERAVLALGPQVFLVCDEQSGSVATDVSGNGRYGRYPANAVLGQPSLMAGGTRSVRLPGGVLTMPYGAWQDLVGDYTVLITAAIAAPTSSTGNFPKLLAKFVDSGVGSATYMLQATKTTGQLVGRASTPGKDYNDVGDTTNVMDGAARCYALRRSGDELALFHGARKVGAVTVSGANRTNGAFGPQVGGSGSNDAIDAGVMWVALFNSALTDDQLANLAQLATAQA